jgi:hypothetical protein
MAASIAKQPSQRINNDGFQWYTSNTDLLNVAGLLLTRHRPTSIYDKRLYWKYSTKDKHVKDLRNKPALSKTMHVWNYINM